jgi:ankyrin repeat protein
MFFCRTKDFYRAERTLRENEDLNLNEVGVKGNTALHFIARAKNTELYNLMVERGADENVKNMVNLI